MLGLNPLRQLHIYVHLDWSLWISHNKVHLSKGCFVGLVIELEVDKVEAAEVVDKDGGALVALLGKFAFQLCIKTYFR